MPSAETRAWSGSPPVRRPIQVWALFRPAVLVGKVWWSSCCPEAVMSV